MEPDLNVDQTGKCAATIQGNEAALAACEPELITLEVPDDERIDAAPTVRPEPPIMVWLLIWGAQVKSSKSDVASDTK